MQPAFPVLAGIVNGRRSQDPMVSVAVPLTGPGSRSERPAWRSIGPPPPQALASGPHCGGGRGGEVEAARHC